MEDEADVVPSRSFEDNKFIFEERETIADGLGPTFLLKNALSGDTKARRGKSVPRPDKKPFPYIRGDVISQTLNNERRFIYYDGAKYAWYGSRSYRGEVPRRLPH